MKCVLENKETDFWGIRDLKFINSVWNSELDIGWQSGTGKGHDGIKKAQLFVRLGIVNFLLCVNGTYKIINEWLMPEKPRIAILITFD